VSAERDAARSAAPIDRALALRATLRAMRLLPFFFAYFWFSHRTGGGEASA
jgi:hypothetical protein